eukprot:jgi/Chrzof1/13462/UNPLg00545.t1
MEQRFTQLQSSLAAYTSNQLAASNHGSVQHNAAGAAQQQGPVCFTCGFQGVHRNNVCYIANPEAAPSWRPGPKLTRSPKSDVEGQPPQEGIATSGRAHPCCCACICHLTTCPPTVQSSGGHSSDLCVLVTKQECIEHHAPVKYHAVLASDAAQAVGHTPRSFGRVPGGRSGGDIPPVQYAAADMESSVDTAVWLRMYLDRDADMLHTVKTRNAASAGASVLEPVQQSLVAFVPGAVDSQQWLADYNNRDVSLNYVINRSPEEGITFTTPDGRNILCQKLMPDDGSTTNIMEADYCHSIGLTWYQAPEISLRSAGYKAEDVMGRTPTITVTLAKGTSHETSIQVSFLVLKGVQDLYTVLLGKKHMRELGAYVDPCTKQFVYRSRLQSHGDLQTKHMLPVKCSVARASDLQFVKAAQEGVIKHSIFALDVEVSEQSAVVHELHQCNTAAPPQPVVEVSDTDSDASESLADTEVVSEVVDQLDAGGEFTSAEPAEATPAPRRASTRFWWPWFTVCMMLSLLVDAMYVVSMRKVAQWCTNLYDCMTVQCPVGDGSDRTASWRTKVLRRICMGNQRKSSAKKHTFGICCSECSRLIAVQ